MHLYGLGSEDWGHPALTPNTETLLVKGRKTHTSAMHKFAVRPGVVVHAFNPSTVSVSYSCSHGSWPHDSVSDLPTSHSKYSGAGVVARAEDPAGTRGS